MPKKEVVNTSFCFFIKQIYPFLRTKHVQVNFLSAIPFKDTASVRALSVSPSCLKTKSHFRLTCGHVRLYSSVYTPIRRLILSFCAIIKPRKNGGVIMLSQLVGIQRERIVKWLTHISSLAGPPSRASLMRTLLRAHSPNPGGSSALSHPP